MAPVTAATEAVNVPFRLTVVALKVIAPGWDGASLQSLTVIVPVPDLAVLVPQSLFAFTVMPEAAIEPAVVVVNVIEFVVDDPLKPLGKVQV